MLSDALIVGADGRPTCFWAVGDGPGNVPYHDDDKLFERLTQAHDFCERHGGMAIVRTLAPFVAGVARMEIHRLLFYAAVASALPGLVVWAVRRLRRSGANPK